MEKRLCPQRTCLLSVIRPRHKIRKHVRIVTSHVPVVACLNVMAADRKLSGKRRDIWRHGRWTQWIIPTAKQKSKINSIWHWLCVSHVGNSTEWTTLKYLLRHADEKALFRARDPSIRTDCRYERDSLWIAICEVKQDRKWKQTATKGEMFSSSLFWQARVATFQNKAGIVSLNVSPIGGRQFTRHCSPHFVHKWR